MSRFAVGPAWTSGDAGPWDMNRDAPMPSHLQQYAAQKALDPLAQQLAMAGLQNSAMAAHAAQALNGRPYAEQVARAAGAFSREDPDNPVLLLL